jgi:Predicted transcriptional regulators
MNLGNKIRELRHEKQLTQEQLASALNISPQAISKWEMNAGYPDMTLIPVIAGFFKVSLDTLFDYDVNKVDGQIEQIIMEGKKYFWSNFEKAEQIFIDGIKAYPSSDKIKAELLDLYLSNGGERDGISEKAQDIASKIILESQDIFCICRAKANLAGIYSRQKRYDDAKNLILSLPYMYPYMLQDRMRCSAYGLKGTDRLNGAKEWKQIEWQELFIACGQEGQGYYEIGDYENAITSFTESCDVIERFMISGKIGYDAYLIGGTHSNHTNYVLMIAACKFKLNQTGEIQKLIEKAKHIYFGAYTKDEIAKDEKLKQNLIENFSSLYNDAASLNQYKQLVLDI